MGDNSSASVSLQGSSGGEHPSERIMLNGGNIMPELGGANGGPGGGAPVPHERLQSIRQLLLESLK